MLGMWDVEGVGCLGYGMLGIWNVREMRCLRCRMLEK